MPLDEKRCCAKVLLDRGEAGWLEPLGSALEGIRTYPPFSLDQVKRPDDGDKSTSFLHSTGQNLWSVLAAWKGAPIRHKGRFEWVMAQARAAFPDLLETVEIDRGQAALFR